MASLMTALGYDQYNLYGTSYGTKLAQVALRETPDRVRSVVLDGATPITGGVAATSGIEQQEQYVRIFEQCAADEACNAAYPNLAERFTVLLDQLEANPITVDPPIQPSGLPPAILPSLAEGIDTIDPDFFRTLTKYNNKSANVLYASAGYNVLVDQMPRLILAVEEGDLDYVRTYFEAPPLPAGGEAVVESVVNILDESDVIPDNPLIARSLETLLTEAQTAVDTDATPDANWVSLVVNELAERLQAGEEQTDILRAMLRLAVLPAKGHEVSLLTEYANEHLSEATAAQANEIVAVMSPVDIRATMWHINDIAAAMSFNREQVGGLHQLVTYAVNCPESVVHHTQADIDAAVAAAEYPQLDSWKDSTGFPFFTTVCGYFPPSNIDRSFLDPINSDAPALILEGALDTQTPPSGAQEITTYLQNSKYVGFESEGHVVAGKHPSCAGTIAAQFLNDPTAELDTSCADAFVIEFELP